MRFHKILSQQKELIKQIIMTKNIMTKTQSLQTYQIRLLTLGLFSLAIIFSAKSMADNMPLEQYVLLHKNSQMQPKSTLLAARKSQAELPKFLLGGEDLRNTPILNKDTALKNDHLIDHYIFASPKNTKLAKRIAM